MNIVLNIHDSINISYKSANEYLETGIHRKSHYVKFSLQICIVTAFVHNNVIKSIKKTYGKVLSSVESYKYKIVKNKSLYFRVYSYV